MFQPRPWRFCPFCGKPWIPRKQICVECEICKFCNNKIVKSSDGNKTPHREGCPANYKGRYVERIRPEEKRYPTNPFEIMEDVRGL